MQYLRRPLTAATRQICRHPSTPRPSAVISTGFLAAKPAHRPFSTSPSRPSTTSLLPPLNLPKWLSENSHLLKPPINNYCVTHDPMTIMIVGGPNARTDYHVNSTPEFFFQYRGRMLLKTIQTTSSGKDQFRDIYIDEGEIFALPANIPHNPVRFADTVGVVIEQPREADSLDRLRWYCRACGEKVHEKSFFCEDLGSQIKEAVQAFDADVEARRCGKCGEVNESKPTDDEMERMRTGG